ncbi:hypothetical protein QJS10_CPB15g02072 [Acorus calamus]|uniref:Uncharacterized protein n=1 Tax=Acorus calamus TaxID=4465 RepID=A0AAV9D8D2_ACOCL|nr:hypothetical protein QJS10_CPB15g02072 [Acorus calamus]
MEREDSRSPTAESQRRRSIGEAAKPAMREWRSGRQWRAAQATKGSVGGGGGGAEVVADGVDEAGAVEVESDSGGGRRSGGGVAVGGEY